MTPADDATTCLMCHEAFDVAGPHFRKPTMGKFGYYTCQTK